jgi:hypothetical protein
MRKQALGVIATASVFVLAGCSADSLDITPSANASETSTVSAEATASESATPEASASLDTPMTDVELVLMALMGPDGEYAAGASYEAVLDAFGDVEPYATIYEAEVRHADALVRQLERLGEEVPENPYTGKIEAPADLQTAAEAWAEGEILNVELYDFLISQTDDAQLIKVFENLRAASADSHLPAFEAAAENGGTLDSMSGFGHSDDEDHSGEMGNHSDDATGQGGGQGHQYGLNA